MESFIGLLGAIIGSALTIWSTSALFERKEKERQKTVIAVINATLDVWFNEIYLASKGNLQDLAIGILLGDQLFSDTQYTSLLDFKEKLKEINKSKENKRKIDLFTRELSSKVSSDIIKIYLENLVKEDFLANDHNSAFLGKQFLVYKLELKHCISNILISIYCIREQKQSTHSLNALLYYSIKSIFIFNRLRNIISFKTKTNSTN